MYLRTTQGRGFNYLGTQIQLDGTVTAGAVDGVHGVRVQIVHSEVFSFEC